MSQASVTAQPKKAVAIYVEDEADWRDEVRSCIEGDSDLNLREFQLCSSIDDDFFVRLRSLTGPIVIIIDLRLGNENANYDGYHWLLEQFQNFLRSHACASAFVISGQLNEGIRETLVRRGIPDNHIYDKGSWDDQRDQFLEAMKQALESIDLITLDHIARVGSAKSIDPYLIHTFREIGGSTDSSSSGAESLEMDHALLPMLVMAKDESWKNDGIPDLKLLGRIDNLFSCLGSVHTIAHLEQDSDVLGIEASRPAAPPDCAKSLPFIKTDVIHNHTQEKGDQCLIGIIDDGLDILHEAFLEETGTKSRVIAIWDQTDPTGPPPIIDNKPSFGTEHKREAIDNYTEQKKAPAHLSSKPCRHGTHVASIAAGRPVADFVGGVAPEAKIVVVIPNTNYSPGSPLSLGYSLSHLLALVYIKEVAQREGLPVAINVSQGMNAGAHDGTSLLETGFDKITGNARDTGIVIIKSAGNERNQRTHARITMTSYSTEALRWESRIDGYGLSINRPREVVELWFRSADSIKFRLRNPEEETSDWISKSNLNVRNSFSSGNIYEMSLTPSHEDNGDSRLLITISAGAPMIVSKGVWTLEIESADVKQGEIHAWIERCDSRPIAFVNHVDERFTLSIPGTSRHVIAVGSTASSIPFRLADYSSLGPTRDNRCKPDLSAPGEEICAAMVNSGNGMVHMSGTSMAAPHVSGAIALLFSYWQKRRSADSNWRQFNSAQIQAAITQGSQNFTGRWHEGYGYGILDIDQFFRQLVGTLTTP